MRALISVYDKRGLDAFARDLVALGWEIISTGGTLTYLQNAGIPVTAVDDVTNFPEILDGRVKTLHPAIHGGILARRDRPDDLATMADHDMTPIDMVVGNLYPFEQTIRRPDVSTADVLENIDIGGPAMIRAAAKNYPDVIVLCDPSAYDVVIDALRSDAVDRTMRRALAASAFAHVSSYDSIVASWMQESTAFPERVVVAGNKVLDLRYGENPHQTAAAYRRTDGNAPVPGVLDATQLQGKELSYNNLLDADAAWTLCRQFAEPTTVIVKHMVPCGTAVRETIADAYREALASDPVSAFGGIVALNRPVDGELASELAEIFFEIIIAPEVDAEARSVLARKKNLRVLELPAELWSPQPYLTVRSITGGLLVQDADLAPDDPSTWTSATQNAPSEDQQRDLEMAWLIARSVRSNAIVLVRDQSLVGVGPGQPNRLDSVRMAIARAGKRASGSVLASDAFFPFADGVQTAIEGGIAAIVQPGGSMRDAEVIEAASGAGVPMVFTGLRHFLH